ncbi:MAG: SDR family oxidoreductase [Ruminococcaceae bacterium]|nr:SDR family oxidoreductase [Oscillospiraceae bacterium]
MFDFLKKQRIVVKKETQYVYVDKQQRFKDRVVLVTGATGSIGEAICQRFAIEGATVVLTGRSEEKLISLQKQFQEKSLDVDYAVMDVADEASIKRAMKEVAATHGKIDVLVNNAGYSARTEKRYLHEQSIENIDGLMAVNLRGAILASREAVQYMKGSRHGRIIHVSSIVGMQGKTKHAEYAAAKAGLFGLMKSQAIELGQYGITVNCVSPGLVPRENATDEKLSSSASKNVLDQLCRPEDIAHGVAFLASREADFITGQNLAVDGGRSLGLMGDL